MCPCTLQHAHLVSGEQYVFSTRLHVLGNERALFSIAISISSDYVIVSNAMNRISETQPSSKIGLRNLDNRYKLITKRNIIIENNFESFTVKLPIIRF